MYGLGTMFGNMASSMGLTNSEMAGLMGGGGGGGGYGKMAYQTGLSAGPGGANDMSRYAQISPLMQMAMQGSGQQPFQQDIVMPQFNPTIQSLMQASMGG